MLKKLSVLAVSIFLLSVFVQSSKADELLDVQNQINKKNQELSVTQSNLEKIKRDIASLSGSLNGTQAELDSANIQVENIRKELQLAEEALEEKRDTLATLVDIRNSQIRQIYQYPQRSALEMFLGG